MDYCHPSTPYHNLAHRVRMVLWIVGLGPDAVVCQKCTTFASGAEEKMGKGGAYSSMTEQKLTYHRLRKRERF